MGEDREPGVRGAVLVLPLDLDEVALVPDPGDGRRRDGLAWRSVRPLSAANAGDCLSAATMAGRARGPRWRPMGGAAGDGLGDGVGDGAADGAVAGDGAGDCMAIKRADAASTVIRASRRKIIGRDSGDPLDHRPAALEGDALHVEREAAHAAQLLAAARAARAAVHEQGQHGARARRGLGDLRAAQEDAAVVRRQARARARR